MPSFGIYGANKASPSRFLSSKSHALRGLSPEDIYEIKNAKEKLDLVLSKKKSFFYHQIKKRIDNELNDILKGPRIPKISGEVVEIIGELETQSLRDEVLKMIENGRPLSGIPEYRGKSVDGDPVDFFKKHYSKYIKNKSEVIFTIDLLNIDKPLLTAMRNSVPSAEMPIGNRAARTDAMAKGRFKDSDDSLQTAAIALDTRRRRRRAEERHAKTT